ncbi:MAG: hypothetical protein LUC37_06800 [Prevotella sp.]|nr:hypothetical protein [Prevotella sp.]
MNIKDLERRDLALLFTNVGYYIDVLEELSGGLMGISQQIFTACRYVQDTGSSFCDIVTKDDEMQYVNFNREDKSLRSLARQMGQIYYDSL